MIKNWKRGSFLAFSAMLAVMVLCPIPSAAAGAIAVSTVTAGSPSPVIVPKLVGLVLVEDQQDVVKFGVSGMTGVQIKGAALLAWRADLKAKLGGYLGKPLTQAGRSAIVNDIVLVFQRRGRPIVSVSTPPQEITFGVLQVLVLQGKLGKIRVEGNRWFKAEFLAKMIRAKPGDVIDAKKMDQDLDWINGNPYRHVDLVYEKGSAPGTTDVVLREADSLPLSFSLGYDDTGTALTNNNRVNVGVAWGDVFGADGQLNYQYSASPEMKYFRANSLSYTQPLPWRHTLTILGSYANVLGDVAQPFTLGGFNWQTSARYEAPLPDWRDYKHSIVAGFDFKRGNNDLTFGGTQVYIAPTETVQWSLGYKAGLKDPWGGTALQATLFYSPGSMSSEDNNTAYNQARAGATARYAYGNVQLNRTTGLPFDFSLVNTVTYQFSDANLLPSEQLGFGGYGSIRGYDTRVFNSDHGFIISGELRTPPVSLFKLARLKIADKLKDSFQFLGFADYGSGGNKNLLPGEQSDVRLFGVGPGLRYAILPYLSIRADYGWQLLNQAEIARPYASRSHVGVTLTY